MPRKKTMSVLIPEEPIALDKPTLPDKTTESWLGTVGDIIQVITAGHPLIAHIGIIHSGTESELVCYAPGHKGFPNQFRVGLKDVVVVGHARLKFKGETLPDPSRDRASELDKI